jgi:CheY-like chemotaxis protein/HPt (histidine-containing phosphotransfer) domain-containing protein
MTAPPSHVRVLVVDDDAMSRDLLNVLLTGQGYQVECADSGDAALALLGDHRPAPEIVLADVQMPGTSGSQLADALRGQCGPATLLLAMSGSGPPGEVVSCFDGFVMKPFTMQDLAAVIAASTPLAASAPAAASKSEMDRQFDSHPQEALPPGAGAEHRTDRTPALDERIYNQLADAMPARQLHQMYAMCMKDARDRIATMRGLAAQHDHAQFIRQAHAVKGGCGMLGATELYGMAARLETSGLDAAGLGGAQGVNPLDELAAACDRLERILGARV